MYYVNLLIIKRAKIVDGTLSSFMVALDNPRLSGEIAIPSKLSRSCCAIKARRHTQFRLGRVLLQPGLSAVKIDYQVYHAEVVFLFREVVTVDLKSIWRH
ncbi:hypothetical protein [Herbaspirillum rubrisubalbicans]|uniref:hypothetical protein n=1 Tax=Herbaspirillum rubrisubalbicans TaxID=80842 RepID=UPI0011BD659F|nr:hypothetical protein [Herbaspirillum rubrisubalbicans]